MYRGFVSKIHAWDLPIVDYQQNACKQLFQADEQELADKKKKRTFRKYTYRGVDLDQLLDMTRLVDLRT
jgi:hypothetical protein